MAHTYENEHYADNGHPADPGVEQDQRAARHRDRALEALDGDYVHPHAALVHALLAVEARIEELTCYLTAR
jgi:hypothetical protein